MSGLLAGKVWQSDLDAHLKPLAAALADIAHDDGSKIFPSVAHVAWLLGRSERAVQYGLRELREIGVLEVVNDDSGYTIEYQLAEAFLPARLTWRETRAQRQENEGGATVAPVQPASPGGATSFTRG